MTTATIATTPKSTTPTTFRSISGFALPPMRHNNWPLLYSVLSLKLPPPPCAVLLVYVHSIILYIYIYIYGCVFFNVCRFWKGMMFELCASYLRIIPRIMPPNHTPESYPKNHDYECFFWDCWDCIGLACFNGPDKLIDQCWPDPMIPG